MKNGKLVTAYLDECAINRDMQRSNDLTQLRALTARLEADITGDLYRACLEDGWTQAELDAAYERRFDYRAKR